MKRVKRGTREFQIEDWRRIRDAILERDEHRCRICGKDGVEACLNVHHVDYDRRHNIGSNLVALCSDCHRQVHREGYKPELYQDFPVPWGYLKLIKLD